jgi:hypothetical protein
MIYGLGFRVSGLEIQGLDCKIWSLGFRVPGFRFRV